MNRAQTTFLHLAQGLWRRHGPAQLTPASAPAPPVVPVATVSCAGSAGGARTPEEEDQGPRLAQGWHGVFGPREEESMALCAEQASGLFAQARPLIVLVGDGHRRIPFSYAQGYDVVRRSAERGQLHLYVEFTDAGWAAHCRKRAGRALPAWLHAWQGTLDVVPWEPPVCDTVMTLFELCEKVACEGDMAEALAAVREPMLSHIVQCQQAFAQYAPGLAASIQALGTTLFGPSPQAAEGALNGLFQLLSSQWRDDYINPYLAERLARHAARCPEDVFLVSVGGAHLAWACAPVQQHLARWRNEEALFTHMIVCNTGDALM